MKEYLLDKNKTLKEALKKLESNHENVLRSFVLRIF